MVTIKLSGELCQIAHCSQTELALPPSGRLGDLLECLAQKYPGILGTSADYQWRHGSSHVVIAINGTVVEGDSQQTRLEEIQLSDGDVISLIPPLGGGSDQ